MTICAKYFRYPLFSCGVCNILGVKRNSSRYFLFLFVCVRQRNRWGGPSVMMWAGISSRYRTPLVVLNETLTAQRYIDQILRPYLLPFLQDHPDVTIFQQDNACPQHLWDELGRRIVTRNPRPNNRQISAACGYFGNHLIIYVFIHVYSRMKSLNCDIELSIYNDVDVTV